jgi:hypothetical protein
MEGYVMFFIYGTVFLAGILVGDLIAPFLGRKVYDGVMHISADHDYDDAKITFRLNNDFKGIRIRDALTFRLEFDIEDPE